MVCFLCGLLCELFPRWNFTLNFQAKLESNWSKKIFYFKFQSKIGIFLKQKKNLL